MAQKHEKERQARKEKNSFSLRRKLRWKENAVNMLQYVTSKFEEKHDGKEGKKARERERDRRGSGGFEKDEDSARARNKEAREDGTDETRRESKRERERRGEREAESRGTERASRTERPRDHRAGVADDISHAQNSTGRGVSRTAGPPRYTSATQHKPARNDGSGSFVKVERAKRERSEEAVAAARPSRRKSALASRWRA